MVRKFLLVFVLLIFPGLIKAQKTTVEYGNNASAGHYLNSGGVNLYYEEYGKGEPLVLLHGNGGNINYMSPQIEYFAKNYHVIAMDCRGRGKNELGKDSLTYMQMTIDLNALLNHLKLDSAYIIGRSDGGILALMMAIYYPAKTKKIAAFGANILPDTTAIYPGDFTGIINEAKMADEMMAKKDTSKNWHLIRLRNRMMQFQPHISVSDLGKIKCPTLILSCDRDEIKEAHTLLIYLNITKANLCIFTGETHRITKQNPLLFNTTVDRFFSEPYKGAEYRTH